MPFGGLGSPRSTTCRCGSPTRSTWQLSKKEVAFSYVDPHEVDGLSMPQGLSRFTSPFFFLSCDHGDLNRYPELHTEAIFTFCLLWANEVFTSSAVFVTWRAHRCSLGTRGRYNMPGHDMCSGAANSEVMYFTGQVWQLLDLSWFLYKGMRA